jgi:hypothetical protein
MQTYRRDRIISAAPASYRSSSVTDASNKTGAPANPTLPCDKLFRMSIEKHQEIEISKQPTFTALAHHEPETASKIKVLVSSSNEEHSLYIS